MDQENSNYRCVCYYEFSRLGFPHKRVNFGKNTLNPIFNTLHTLRLNGFRKIFIKSLGLFWANW